MSHSNHTDGMLERANILERFPAVIGMTPGPGDSPLTTTREDLLVVAPKTKAKKPPFYRVVMLNDDYTPMDFVVHVLKNIFRHGHEDAIRIMLEIHHRGASTAGVFTRDVAETKIELVVGMARQSEYPLQCVMEKE